MDVDLSTLERATREHPDDVRAGLAYAAALGRTGERTKEWLELERLAALPSDEAKRKLAAWHPLVPGRASLRRPPIAPHVARREPLEVSPEARVACATDLVAFLQDGDEVVALDVTTLHVRWRARGAPRGLLPDVLLATRGDELVLFDPHFGHELQAIPVGPACEAACDGVHVLAHVPSSKDLVALALGPDRLLVKTATWSDGPVHARPLVVASGRAFVIGSGTVVRRFADGAKLWTSRASHVLAGDEAGVLLLLEDGAIEERDAATGTVRWGSGASGVRVPVLAPRHVAWTTRSSVVLHERATGRRVSSQWFSSPRGLALTEELALFASSEDDALVLTALELGSGAELWTFPLRSSEGTGTVTTVPLERAILVVTGREAIRIT